MKKHIIFLGALLFSGFAFSQVGINTDTPKSTLDVVGKATDIISLDGITAPRLTGNQLRAKTYTSAQTGALVYVTAADSAPAGQTVNVTIVGYYYFDGSVWQKIYGNYTEVDGVIGNEVTGPTANGGLARSGSGTTASPYTLGLTNGTGTGQTMLYNSTTSTWAPAYLSAVLAGVDGVDATPTNFTLSSINGVSTNQILTTKTFTLTSRSMVTFSFSVGIGNILRQNGGLLSDGTSKQIGARLDWAAVPGGSSYTVGNALIRSAVPFTNAGSSYTSGFFYLNGTRSFVMAAGTYSVDLVGYVFAQDNVQGVQASFSGIADQFDIIAVPIQ